MNTEVRSAIKEVIHAVHYRPAVSILLPFDIKMNLQTEMEHTLKSALDYAEKELLATYPADVSRVVIEKLRFLCRDILFDTRKKSIAIFVSPVFEKVCYLDIMVSPKVVIDESFEIRDLIYSNTQQSEYLMLVLSANTAALYKGDTGLLEKIHDAIPTSSEAYKNDIAERVTNFSDVAERKEILMEKFLHHIDHALEPVLNKYQLPLVILGTDRIAGHFKQITHNSGYILDYVHGNFEEATTEELKMRLKGPSVKWHQLRQQQLMNEIVDADGRKQLASGIHDVWQAAANRKGRVLVVETNYSYPMQTGDGNKLIAPISPEKKVTGMKDAVDEVIEKVLESGGSIRFVDKGLLKDFRHIALIQYY